jgi:hypothetical protein
MDVGAYVGKWLLMADETLATVFLVAYVCVGAAGMLPYALESVQGPAFDGLQVAHVRTDGFTVWSYGDVGTFDVVKDGVVHRLDVGVVYLCDGRYQVLPGTVIPDTTLLRCFTLEDQLKTGLPDDGRPLGEDMPMTVFCQNVNVDSRALPASATVACNGMIGVNVDDNDL